MRGKIVRGADGRAHRTEIAWAAPAQRETGERPGKVGRGLQGLPQFLAQAWLTAEIGDGVEAGIDRIHIGQGTGQPACQLTGAGGGDRAIDRSQKTARARSVVGPRKLEIGAGGRIDQKKAAGDLFARRAEQRGAADLGDLYISCLLY